MLKKLAAHFENREQLPIELPEIRTAILSFGVQDSIVFSGEDMDPGRCRGAFYQYTNRSGIYGDLQLNTLIVYSKKLDITWQRMICCKEVIHVLDHAAAKTKDATAVVALAEKVLGPLSSETYGLADLMAASDRIALYQALAVIFPMAAWQVAMAKFRAGKKTAIEIAEWACLPADLIEHVVLQDGWPRLRDELLSC